MIARLQTFMMGETLLRYTQSVAHLIFIFLLVMVVPVKVNDDASFFILECAVWSLEVYTSFFIQFCVWALFVILFFIYVLVLSVHSFQDLFYYLYFISEAWLTHTIGITTGFLDCHLRKSQAQREVG